MVTTFIVIVQFDGDKVAHEHLYWDQASVLVQVGLLDRTLPVRGGEIAAQVLSPTQPMNELKEMSHDEFGLNSDQASVVVNGVENCRSRGR